MHDLFEEKNLTYAEIAIAVPAGDHYTYSIPSGLVKDCQIGKRVSVPFSNRAMIGYIVGLTLTRPDYKLKSITDVLDEHPVVSETILKLCKKVSEYYGCSLGEAIENALPKWIKYGKTASRAKKKDTFKDVVQEINVKNSSSFELSQEQKNCFQEISKALESKDHRPIYIQGVTGSGKSELYIRTIRKVLEQNKSVIVLVPEITLTEQLKFFFANQFQDRLEILHSKMTARERFLAWKRIESDVSRVVLGPRSALFAPLKNLGAIIIDEEHESTYKQETVPRYHARDVAISRAELENALLIMGSATPSMEALLACREDKFKKMLLSKRIDDRKMPEINIVDLKEEAAVAKKGVLLSRVLVREMEKVLKKGEGVLLLLNRRGFSSHVHCVDCGHTEDCPSCHISLTYHMDTKKLLCHYCNFQKSILEGCPSCSAKLLKFSGAGTERIESIVAQFFPQAKIARLDADAVKKEGAHEQIIRDFREQKTDILIGTQMIAKGFDFPNVTLVGVISADVGLMLPDFRSSEKTFQLLTQVSGRAGRGTKLGKVIIQTYSPQHPAVRLAYSYDIQKFYDYCSEERILLGYPPFKKLINVIFRGKNEKTVYEYALKVCENFKTSFPLAKCKEELIEWIGPSPLPFYKLRGQFRWHIMVKTSNTFPSCARYIEKALAEVKKKAGVQWAIDVDPLQIL